ncbi:MAG: YjjG family noncanonical pyrimidine nucleotidase [Oscillospiraceae bacterium]
MYKAILWDVDGTLLDFNKSLSAGMKSCFRQCGLGECTDSMVERYHRINEGWWQRLERGETTREELFLKRFEDFFGEYGLSYDTQEFDRLYKLSLREYVFFNDNSGELVKSLRGRVEQYAVSNTPSAELVAKLRRSGLDKLLDGVFIAEMLGEMKPSPLFYDKVFSAIPWVKRGEALMVGDSLTSDIRGANNAGIACCWYNTERKSAPPELRIDYTITNLNEIKNII